MSPKLSPYSPLIITLIMIGTIGITAMMLDYSGKVEINVGLDGIQFQINGDKTDKRRLNP